MEKEKRTCQVLKGIRQLIAAVGMAALVSCTGSSAIENGIRPDAVGENKKFIFGEIAEVFPQYPGGIEAMQQFIAENLRYPEVETCIQGKVVVSFLVQTDGSLADIKVVRGLDDAFDEEALRVVKLMPKWEPGRIGGKIVAFRYTIPVRFKLE